MSTDLEYVQNDYRRRVPVIRLLGRNKSVFLKQKLRIERIKNVDI